MKENVRLHPDKRKADNMDGRPLQIPLLCENRLNGLYPFVNFFRSFGIALIQAESEHPAAPFHAGELKIVSAGAYIADKSSAAIAQFVVEVRRSRTEAVGMTLLTADADDSDVLAGKIDGVQQLNFAAPVLH